MARLAPIALLVFTLGCFSAFNMSRYRAPNSSARAVKTVAVTPLVVIAASETKNTVSWVPGWFFQQSQTLPMSAAEYQPAQDKLSEAMRQALPGRGLVLPQAVDAAMVGAHPASEQELVAEVARRTGADAVLIFRVRNFNQRNAGLEQAQASGTADASLYGAQGSLIWSLAAEVVRGPIGSNAAPSLLQFIDFAMERFGPEISRIMEEA